MMVLSETSSFWPQVFAADAEEASLARRRRLLRGKYQGVVEIHRDSYRDQRL